MANGKVADLASRSVGSSDSRPFYWRANYAGLVANHRLTVRGGDTAC
jgi:hypothetical protein